MKKSLANIRFIGELYKCQILTDRKMHEIIRRLLLPIEPDENSVELLCCLLKSIGEKLELRTQQKISTGDVSNEYIYNRSGKEKSYYLNRSPIFFLELVHHMRIIFS